MSILKLNENLSYKIKYRVSCVNKQFEAGPYASLKEAMSQFQDISGHEGVYDAILSPFYEEEKKDDAISVG